MVTRKAQRVSILQIAMRHGYMVVRLMYWTARHEYFPTLPLYGERG